MIKKQSEMRPRVREGIQGGHGAIADRIILEPEEMQGHCKLFTRFTLNPGDSIGLHTHTEDAEIYYILSGELVVCENGVDITLHAGDVAYTSDGASHSLENRSPSPAEMLAVIFPE